MSCEVRRVPAGWVHPRDERGRLVPMLNESYDSVVAEVAAFWAAWTGDGSGLTESDSRARAAGEDPDVYAPYLGSRADYMPDWPESERTHLMMYETVSEGTPISPAFATPEELARWLADNGASAGGRATASYEHWLVVARDGWAPSGMIINGEMLSGVEAIGRAAERKDGDR